MFTDFKRVIRAGILNFFRNGFVSLASVLVLTITLFMIGSLVFFSAIMETALAQIKDKVDVNVYFLTGAEEAAILALQKELSTLPEIEKVTYTSKEDALALFKDRHSNDILTLQALEELGENPLGASLNIKAKDAEQYASIARFLENKNTEAPAGERIIDKVNYYQNKVVIDRLARVIDSAETLGIAIVAILAFISLIITFNTIRLAIYTAREEISVMRLVGAEKRYIRGPFLVEGFLHGVISAVIVLVLFFPLTYYLGGPTARFFGGVNVYEYYLGNFGELFLIVVLSGIALGIGSSFIAVRRYITKKYLKH
ncbi:MAG: ABC transporter permease [Parcubacteria group bacterium]|nr:ABC transporter permease [Parcubacteria group bacterium]